MKRVHKLYSKQHCATKIIHVEVQELLARQRRINTGIGETVSRTDVAFSVVCLRMKDYVPHVLLSILVQEDLFLYLTTR